MNVLAVLASRPCEKYHDYSTFGHTSVPSPKCQTEPCLVCQARLLTSNPDVEAATRQLALMLAACQGTPRQIAETLIARGVRL